MIKYFFWLYVSLAGIIGLTIYFSDDFIPWYKEKKKTDYFKERVNYLFIILIGIVFSTWLVTRFFNIKDYIVLIIFLSFMIGAAYLSTYFIKRIMVIYKINLKFICLVMVLLILSSVVINLCKNVLFVDFKDSNKRYELLFNSKKEEKIKSIFMREYDNFVLTPQIAFSLKFNENNEKTIDIGNYPKSTNNLSFEAQRTGYYNFEADHTENSGILVVTVFSGFKWKRLLLNNHLTARYSVLFLVILIIGLYSIPKKYHLREEGFMDFSKNIPGLKNYESFLALHQDDSNMLFTLFRSWRQRFGNRLNINNMLSQIEDIEVKTKALIAWRLYQEEVIKIDNEEDFITKKKIKQKELERDLLKIEAEIEELQGKKQKEPINTKSEHQKILDGYLDDAKRTTAQIDNILMKIQYIQKVQNEIEKTYGKEVSDDFRRILSEEGILPTNSD